MRLSSVGSLPLAKNALHSPTSSKIWENKVDSHSTLCLLSWCTSHGLGWLTSCEALCDGDANARKRDNIHTLILQEASLLVIRVLIVTITSSVSTMRKRKYSEGSVSMSTVIFVQIPNSDS